MTNFDAFAEYYDSLYRDKDYEGECRFLEVLFKTYATIPVATVLELGCGTGGHGIPLSSRGFSVFGVDRSEKMLVKARNKSIRAGCDIRFQQNDIRDLRLGRKFDAVIIPFNVIGYLTENAAVHQAMETIHLHLKDGGVLIFDFWFGPSVLTDRPSPRLKETVSNSQTVYRFADPRLDVLRNRVAITYRILSIKDQKVMANLTERHDVRFFFLPELAEFLNCRDMEMLHVCKWMHIADPPDDAWNACVVAANRGSARSYGYQGHALL